MSPRNKDVFPAVVIKIGNRRRIPRHRQTQLRHPALPGYFCEGALTSVAINRKSLSIKRHHNNVGIAVVIQISKVDAHARNVGAIFPQGNVDIEANFFIFATSFVAEE